MAEIKTKVKQSKNGDYVITNYHTTADIVRWLLTQESKETILYFIKKEKS